MLMPPPVGYNARNEAHGLLRRRPEEMRCMEVASEPPDRPRLRWALIDEILVLMVIAMVITP